MRLYNVTDKSLPRQEQALNLTLRKCGLILPPGGYVEVKDIFALGQIAGWIRSGWVAVNDLPAWYVVEPPPEPEPEPVPEPEPEPEIKTPYFLTDTE